MKALIQRVHHANVHVADELVGQIDHGILAYIGIGREDTLDTAKKLVDKLLTYRIFENEQGKLDDNVQQVGGGLLLVSQFTLMARTDKGRRPDFSDAMPPADAQKLFDELVAYAHTQHNKVQTGRFGANMQVHALNDGPINLILTV